MQTQELSRRYLAVLAVAAGGLLVFGILLRPAKTVPPVPSQAALTPRPSGADLRQFSAELLARASARARHLTWLPETRATAVAWESPGTLITTGPNGIERLHRPGIAQEPAPVYRGRLPDNDWLTAVARTADGQTIWTAGMYGGIAPADCAGFGFQELKIATPLTDAFAGAAVVDLDNRVVGIVVRCAGRLAAMSADAVSRALAGHDRPPGAWLSRLFGVRTERLDERLALVFETSEGMLVTEVPADGPADIQPGDIILSLPPEAVPQLEVLRAGRTVTVRLPPLTAVRGMILESVRRALFVRSVESTSGAGRAGIRAGDVLVSAGYPPATRATAVLDVLAQPGDQWVVYEREGSRRGVLLP
jgi:hypothetical protein